jgi:TPR repeat protein
MSRRARAWRRLAPAWLLALAFAGNASAADRAPIVDPDVAWTRFLAEGNSERAFKLYTLIDDVEGTDIEVDAGPCTDKAAELDAALREMPAGIALWYTAYRCAQARGDSDAADHYLAGFSRLAKHALAQANDDIEAPPIRVFAYPDIRTLVQASGMEYRYGLLDPDRPRYLEIVQALTDAKAGRERRLRFDFVDTLVRLARNQPEARYPMYRKLLVDALVASMAEGGLHEAVDLRAVRQAAEVHDVPARLALLRPVAEAGGLQAAWEWLYLCVKQPTPGCGDGLVEALLPAAEQRHATAMVLLGLAYAEGVGVDANSTSAMALLDAADKQLGDGMGVVLFARYHFGLHPSSLPAELRTRLERAAGAGHPLATRLLAFQRYTTPGYRLTDADLAPLIALADHGHTQVAATIGRMLMAARRFTEAAPWIAKGAAAGSPEAQEMYSVLLHEGYGVARDAAAATRWAQEAAAGGNVDAMRKLGLRAAGNGDWTAAEKWLLSAMMREDLDAALALARLYSEGHPGLSEKPGHAVVMLESLDESMDKPEIRRALSQLYGQGKGVRADPAKARALLEGDAERGDRLSQLMLASALGSGKVGPLDAAAAERWFTRASESGDPDAIDAHAFWLFYRVDTAESRARALALWRGIAPAPGVDADSAWNNLAWALCTTRDAALRAPAEGMTVAGRLGEIAVLPLGQRDTVAACLAANGRFDEAAALQRGLIERLASASASDPSLPQMRARLALYDADQPYIEVELP